VHAFLRLCLATACEGGDGLTLGSCSHELLHDAEFYERRSIRQALPSVLLEQLGQAESALRRAVRQQDKAAWKAILQLVENSGAGDATAASEAVIPAGGQQAAALGLGALSSDLVRLVSLLRTFPPGYLPPESSCALMTKLHRVEKLFMCALVQLCAGPQAFESACEMVSAVRGASARLLLSSGDEARAVALSEASWILLSVDGLGKLAPHTEGKAQAAYSNAVLQTAAWCAQLLQGCGSGGKHAQLLQTVADFCCAVPGAGREASLLPSPAFLPRKVRAATSCEEVRVAGLAASLLQSLSELVRRSHPRLACLTCFAGSTWAAPC